MQKDTLLAEVEEAENSSSKRLEAINLLLRENDIKAMMIWRLADREKAGWVMVADLQSALAKLSPSLPKSSLEAFAEVFPENHVRVLLDNLSQFREISLALNSLHRLE